MDSNQTNRILQHDIKILETVEKVSTTPIIWNDCDKICNGSGIKNGKLSAKERSMLHSVKTKLLRREIEITKPTHIVFLGWYTKSLMENTLFFYSKYQKTESRYNYPLDIQNVKIGYDELKLYYLYHPSLRKNRDKYNKDIEQVIQDIKIDKEMILKEKTYKQQEIRQTHKKCR